MRKEEMPDKFRSELLSLEKLMDSRGYSNLFFAGMPNAGNTVDNVVNYLTKTEGIHCWEDLAKNVNIRMIAFPMAMHFESVSSPEGNSKTHCAFMIHHTRNKGFQVGFFSAMKEFTKEKRLEVYVKFRKHSDLPPYKKLDIFLDKLGREKISEENKLFRKTFDAREVMGRGRRIR